MMSADKTNDGGPAFPVTFEHSEATSEKPGMSLRDYFAGQALAGLLAAGYEVSDSTIAEAVTAGTALVFALEATK